MAQGLATDDVHRTNLFQRKVDSSCVLQTSPSGVVSQQEVEPRPLYFGVQFHIGVWQARFLPIADDTSV